jgi:hypothetical protein
LIGIHEYCIYHDLFSVVVLISIMNMFPVGTGGCNIKKITQLSGANTRLADYSDLYNTKERLVTLASTVPAEIITVGISYER